MIESKTELKVVVATIALIGAPLLGVDAQLFVQVFADPEASKALDEIVKTSTQLARSQEKITLSALLAGVTGIYTAGRTVYKAVSRWVDGKETENMRGRVE